jgi:hypothetical protein
MKRTLWFLLAAFPMFAQSSGSNGVYGGYVGSSRWFDSMRQSAANMALLQSLGGASGRQPVPPDYSEVAGIFTFVQGNPFPKNRLPDLRILCADQTADRAERSPFITQSEGEPPSFYTVLKRGQTYRFSWMYYFGSKEVFATLTVPSNASKQLRLVVSVDPKGAGQTQLAGNPSANEVSHPPAPTSGGQPAPQPPRTNADGLGDLMRSFPPGAPGTGPQAGAEASSQRGPDLWALSGLPKPPTTPEEEQVWAMIHTAKSPGTKAAAHQRLAEYWEAKGEQAKAGRERARAQYWANLR